MSDKQPPPPPYHPQGGYPPPQQGYPPPQQGYPPPQQGYPPQQPVQYTAAANVAAVPQGAALVTATFGEHPLSNFQCPYCRNVVTTKTRNKIGTTAIIITVIAFLFIGILAVIFLFIPGLNDVEHVCPVDGRVVGTYERKLF